MSERTAQPSPVKPKDPTGIHGLDDVLFGGLPRGRTTLVIGGPGSGKTVLALESIYRAASGGEPGIIVGFEEDAAELRRNALTFDWDLADLERSGRLAIVSTRFPSPPVPTGDFDIHGLLAQLAGHAREIRARRVMIDAIDMLLRICPDPVQRGNQLALLNQWLLEHELSAVLTAKAPAHDSDLEPRLEYLVDCVLRLDQRVVSQVTTRRLRVVKYRGSAFRSNEFPFIISGDGIKLMPVSSVQLSETPVGAPVSIGVPAIDRVMGGGIARGSAMLVVGGSGTGKTTLGCAFAVSACQRNERVLYLSFEESARKLTHNMRSVGTDVQAQLDRGYLEILTAMPETTGVEEHLWRILERLDTFAPAHLVIDPISATRRMGADTAAFDLLMRLLSICQQRGITTLMLELAEPAGIIAKLEKTHLVSVVDTVLLLEQHWSDNQHRRRLLVVKMRGVAHAHTPFDFAITNTGISVAAPPPTRASGASV